mmetsp:Transcript_14782/g.31701  ORF Transcript_14782/g.31701 Transcript_14782/m.31701 type:complete len:178 (-) Transcript_14782:51-584(-)
MAVLKRYSASFSTVSILSSSMDRVKIPNLLNPAPSTTAAADQELTPRNAHAAPSARIQAVGSTAALPKQRRRLWTEEEDALLLELLEKHGPGKWTKLAHHFEDRSGPQLRARWAHSLSDRLSIRPYTPEEDEYILRAQKQLGNCWVAIARGMEHRIGNGVKNRYLSLTRQTTRDLQN